MTVMALGKICHILVLVCVFVDFNMGTAQIFIGDENSPGILYAPLPDPRDDTNILDVPFILIPLPDGTTIDGIDYDPSNETVYWNDFSNDQISRVHLDGTNREIIVNTSSPHSIALDLVNGKIYWTLYNEGSIARANLNGTDVEKLYTYEDFVQPTSILVDPITGYLLWSTRIVDQIVKASLNGSNQENVKNIYAEGMTAEQCADDTTRLFYYTAQSTLGLVNTDGSGGQTIETFSRPALGSTINKYGSKIFWSATGMDRKKLIYEYDMKFSNLRIHNVTMSLTDGSFLEIEPTTTRIIANTTYNEPVAIERCPNDIIIVLKNNFNLDVAPVSWIEPGLNSWSSCPTMEFLGPGTNGGTFSLGTTSLTYRARDAAGNTDVCQFSVTVQRSREITDGDGPDCHDDHDGDSGSSPIMSSSIFGSFFIALILLALQ